MPTINLQVGASADDANEIGGTAVSITAVGALNDATNEWDGVRFQNVTIPPGALILSAVAQFVVFSTIDDPNHTIYGEDIDDAPAFTIDGANLSSRTRTTATATWTSSGLGADSVTYFPTPDLSAIIQEIVDRGGWASGNAIVLLIQGSADASRDLGVATYDNSPSTAAKLDITYSVPRATRSVYHHLVGGMR